MISHSGGLQLRIFFTIDKSSDYFLSKLENCVPCKISDSGVECLFFIEVQYIKYLLSYKGFHVFVSHILEICVC